VNPPAAVQRPDAGPTSPPRRTHRAPIVLGAVAVVAVFVIAQLLAAPHYVSRLTFQNPTPYELTVEVSNGHGDGWLPLGTIDRRSSTQFGEIYDVGDGWEFRVWAQGAEAGRFRLTRAQLEQSGWRVQVPRQIGDDLTAAGVERQP
jgi:hypothetical protein